MADALDGWQSGRTQRWRRVRVGWPNEEGLALCFTTSREHDGALVQVRAQERGKMPAQLWYPSERGDIHTRADYMAALIAFLQCGFHAGFISPQDAADALAVMSEWRFKDA